MIFCKIKLTFKRLHWQGETKISYQVASFKKKSSSFYNRSHYSLSSVSNQQNLGSRTAQGCLSPANGDVLFLSWRCRLHSLIRWWLWWLFKLGHWWMLIFFWASLLEILRWPWRVSKLNVRTELCSGLCLPQHLPPFFFKPCFSSLGIHRRLVTSDTQNLLTYLGWVIPLQLLFLSFHF